MVSIFPLIQRHQNRQSHLLKSCWRICLGTKSQNLNGPFVEIRTPSNFLGKLSILTKRQCNLAKSLLPQFKLRSGRIRLHQKDLRQWRIRMRCLKNWLHGQSIRTSMQLLAWCPGTVSMLFLSSLTCTQDLVAYLHKGGRNYLRMSISKETLQKADNFIKAVNQMGDFNTVSCSKAPSNALNPKMVRWFLCSRKVQCDVNSMDMHKVIKRLCNIKGPFGLFWTNVKSNQPYDKNRKQIKAMHLEVE